MNSLVVKEVNFYDGEILGIKTPEGKIYMGVSKACYDIGLTEKQKDNEVEKIQKDLVLHRGAKKLPLKFGGQVRHALCIEKDFVPLWLAKISITPTMQQQNPATVERLIKYQLEAKDVLADAFIKKRIIKDEKYLIQREAGKMVRNMLTDTIKEKLPESPNKHFMYPNYTKLIYKILFNKTVSELRAEKGLTKKDNLREHFNVDELKEIQVLENTITGLINLGMGYHEIKEILNQRYLKQIA